MRFLRYTSSNSRKVRSIPLIASCVAGAESSKFHRDRDTQTILELRCEADPVRRPPTGDPTLARRNQRSDCSAHERAKHSPVRGGLTCTVVAVKETRFMIAADDRSAECADRGAEGGVDPP